VEYCNSCTERWPSCPKYSAGQCSWAGPKRTCSAVESPSAEQSPTPRLGDPPSSEQLSRLRNYSATNPSGCPNGHSQYATEDATYFPGKSPSAEQSPTPRPHNPPSSEHSSRCSESEAWNDPPPAGQANLQAQNNPPPPGLANSGPWNCLPLGQKYRHPPANISAINHLALPMFIPGMPVRVQHAPANVQDPKNPAGVANLQALNNAAGAANLQAPNNPAGAANPPVPNNPAGAANSQAPKNTPIPVNIPARIQVGPPMGILGTLLGIQDAPPADIPVAAALIVQDPALNTLARPDEYFAQCGICSKLVSFFTTIRMCLLSTDRLRIYRLECYAWMSKCCSYCLGP